jgi:cell division septation protein DedD
MPETSDHASAADTVPTRLDQSQHSHLDDLYRAAIGPLQAGYYLPILSRFEAYGRASPSWNWAACGITLNWMLFRGLWLPAVSYLATLSAAALALAAGIALADPPPAQSVQWGLWAALLTLALLVPGFFGNAWLYRVYRRRLDTALAATASLKDACMLLARQSSSRPRLLAIALVNVVPVALVAATLFQPDLHRRMWPRVSGDVGGAVATGNAPVANRTDGPAAVTPAADTPQAGRTMPTRPHEQAASDAVAAVTTHIAPAASGASSTTVLADHDIRSLEAAARTAAQRQELIAAQSRAARVRAAAATASAPASAMAAAAAAAAATNTAAAQPPVADKQPAPSRSYLIDVGLFAQQDNALRAHARLKQAGLPALSESLQTPRGQRTRVRVGPFATRAQADAAAQQIRAMQLDAVMVRP